MKNDSSTTLDRTSPWLFIVGWSLVNIVGFGLVGALFHNFPLAFTFPPNVMQLRSFNFGAALFGGLTFGFVPALPLGFLQRLVLSRQLPISRWWIITAPIGVGCMHFMSDGFESARDLSIAVILGGLIVGLWQWLLLRRQLPASGWWVVAVILNWYLGWVISFSMMSLFKSYIYIPADAVTLKTHGLQGLVVGLTNGLLSGITMIWLLSQPRMKVSEHGQIRRQSS